jgi:hypothetical protein
MEVKNIILHNLATNEEYSRKILPFIKVEYFQEQSDKIVFTCIRDFILEYNDLPTKEAVVIALDSKKNIYERQYNSGYRIRRSSKAEPRMVDGGNGEVL